MTKEALKKEIDDLISEYHMENSSFARRVGEIFKASAENDLSDYVCVGSLTLAGIEDEEYGQSEIDSLESAIEALQEQIITGCEHKKVPLLAYIGEFKKFQNPAPKHPDEDRIDWLTNNPVDALDIFGHVKGVDAVRWIRQEIDNAIEAKLRENE